MAVQRTNAMLNEDTIIKIPTVVGDKSAQLFCDTLFSYVGIALQPVENQLIIYSTYDKYVLLTNHLF